MIFTWGRPVPPDEFYDRKQELDEILEHIKVFSERSKVDHLMVITRRRVGKTSFIDKTVAELQKQIMSTQSQRTSKTRPIFPVKVNCEGVVDVPPHAGQSLSLESQSTNIEKFLSALLTSTERTYFELRQKGSYDKYNDALSRLGNKIGNAFKSVFRGFTVTEIEANIIPKILEIKMHYQSSKNWEDALKEFTEKMCSLYTGNVTFVFFIDEFGHMKHLGENFWLRLRSTLQDKDCPFLFVVSGSYGLRQMNDPLIFREFPLKFGLEEDEAKRLLNDGINPGYQIGRPVFKTLFDFSNRNAMYLQMCGDALLKLGKKVITKQDAEKAITDILSEPQYSSAFNNIWRFDIKKHYGNPELAHNMLRIIASRQTVKRDALIGAFTSYDEESINDTLLDLTNNFYIELDKQNQLTLVDYALRAWINKNHPWRFRG